MLIPNPIALKYLVWDEIVWLLESPVVAGDPIVNNDLALIRQLTCGSHWVSR
jgi:hypothetical protein